MISGESGPQVKGWGHLLQHPQERIFIRFRWVEVRKRKKSGLAMLGLLVVAYKAEPADESHLIDPTNWI